MNEPSSNLERLISRYLDQECTPEERKQLQEMLREDSSAAEFLEDTQNLDRELNFALRGAMGRTPVRRLPAPFWSRMGRAVGLGLAATLAGLMCLSPGNRSTPSTGRNGVRTNTASWFAPPPALGDTLAEDPERFGAPQVRLDKAERNWIVVPGETPGEFMVIEVRNTKTHTIPLQEDF